MDPPKLAPKLASGFSDILSSSDIKEIDRTIERFVRDELKDRLGMDFRVWDWTRLELYGLMLGCFVKVGLISNPNTLVKFLGFLIDVAEGYYNNPYHSFLHAVDVTYVLYYTLVDLSVQSIMKLSLMEVAALLISALAHDILHPGLNNLYQVNAKTELAQRFHNQSVLENYSCHHLDILMKKHSFLLELDYQMDVTAVFMEEKTGQSFPFFEYMMIVMKDAILNTDMSCHFLLMEQLANVYENYTISSPPTDSPRLSKSEKLFEHISLTVTGSGSSIHSTIIHPIEKDRIESVKFCSPVHRRHVINALLHAADISNAARPFEICKKWSDLVIEEFFLQGDQECREHLPISPSMDRNKTQPIQVSIQFNDFIARPYFESLSDLFSSMKCFVRLLEENRQKWQTLLDECGSDVPGSNTSLDGAAEEEEVKLGSFGDMQSSSDVSQTSLFFFDSAAVSNPHKSPLSAPGVLTSLSSALLSGGNRRGRRLSVAAGTIEIPDKFVQKSPQTGRLKARSLSHGRPCGSPAGSFRSISASEDGMFEPSQLQSSPLAPKTSTWSIPKKDA